jgi:hypothetical protein
MNGKLFTRSHVLLKVMPVGSHSAKKKQTFLLRNVVAWFRWNGLMAKLHTAIETQVPVGYEEGLMLCFVNS